PGIPVARWTVRRSRFDQIRHRPHGPPPATPERTHHPGKQREHPGTGKKPASSEDRWNRAVAVHEEGRMTEEIRIPKARVPKPYHFGNTIRSLVVTALTAFVWIFTDSFMNMVRHSDDMRTIILIALLVAT